MRSLILIAAVLALGADAPAHADGFDRRETAFQVLNAADAVQTCLILDSGRGYELNPLLGKHPSCAKVAAFKAANGAVHLLVSRLLRDRHPDAAKTWQKVTLGVQGAVVAVNMRFAF